LTDLAWGGLQAGTRFAAPAPLFPRAEKDAVERMQKIEEQNNLSVVQAASVGGTSINRSAIKSERAASTTAAKTADRGAIVSNLPENQTSWENVPVDSVGEDAEAEAQAYETVALSSALAAEPQLAPPGVAQSAPPQVEPVITIDDVIKVDLRVAQILVAERIPKADKLLRLEVDLGYEKRQILAGIAQYYEPEKLVGRKIVIVANLAPRKMRGLESNGMLLAASLEGGSPVLAGFLEDVPLGARLK
jgi:methionyl-tRNA synthetase